MIAARGVTVPGTTRLLPLPDPHCRLALPRDRAVDAESAEDAVCRSHSQSHCWHSPAPERSSNNGI